MKPGTLITLNNLPKCNGRPQLWWSQSKDENWLYDRLRIIYPSGRVHFSDAHRIGKVYTDYSMSVKYVWDNRGCTSARTQKKAMMNCYFYSATRENTYFLGYL